MKNFLANTIGNCFPGEAKITDVVEDNLTVNNENADCLQGLEEWKKTIKVKYTHKSTWKKIPTVSESSSNGFYPESKPSCPMGVKAHDAVVLGFHTMQGQLVV